jgi:transposase
MTRPPSIPADLWATFPIAAQALLAAQFERIAQLEARVADLEARLNQTSANSSLPPSADPPHAKPAPPRSPSGKRRGGQPGHPRAERALLPPDVVVPLKPVRCRRCSGRLTGEDADPLVHQVHEIPAIRPHVTEYRRHRLACPGCGAITCAPLPADATGGYGPRAEAASALLAGGHRLGKRAVSQVMGDLFGLPISPAAVCDLQGKTAAALEPAHAEALGYTRTRPANVDETGWTEGRRRAWLWAAVTTTVTAFLIRLTRGRAAFDDLVGPSPPVLTTDRYGVYTHLPGDQRQVCWAHLRRDFQAMIDRKNAGSGVGEDLLLHADILFRQWARVRDRTLTRAGFRRHYLGWLRAEVRSLLARGAASACARTAGTCREILGVEPALWTFAAVAGVEPTNNAAERALRHAVCWRKTSYGTDTAAGSRFVERMLTVVASCRQQGRDVLGFLVEAVQAARTGATSPSLLPIKA